MVRYRLEYGLCSVSGMTLSLVLSYHPRSSFYKYSVNTFFLSNLRLTRRFVLCLTLCHFVLVFFSPFSIAITSLGEERANLSAFRTFVRFVLVWMCRLPLPLGVWEGLRFVIVALSGFFSYFFLAKNEYEEETEMFVREELLLIFSTHIEV